VRREDEEEGDPKKKTFRCMCRVIVNPRVMLLSGYNGYPVIIDPSFIFLCMCLSYVLGYS
jgi:hypothetical protein